MSAKVKNAVDDVIDVDAIATLSVDDDFVDDDVSIDKAIEMVEDEPETMEDFFEKAMARQEKVVTNAIKTVNKRVDQHDKRISKLEKQQEEIIKALSKSKVSNAVDEEEDNRGVLDKTLGAVGGVMHGIVDTAAFVLESAVDLVTLGRAKRDY